MKKHLYSTNRTLLRIGRGKAFKDLAAEFFPELHQTSLEQYSSLYSYYLLNPISPVHGDYVAGFEKELSRHSQKIFANELSETNIPTNSWPDIQNFELFKEFFVFRKCALIADFGDEEIITTRTEV